jgi:Uncharacterized protein conserved in bacteria (DUF2141)
MLSTLSKTWQVNHGTPIALCSLLAAALMSIAWRFDLIPEIGPPSSFAPGLLGRRSAPAQTLLIVTASAPVKEGNLTLLIQDDELNSVHTQTAPIHDGFSEFVVTQLKRGTYVGRAYIDQNENGQLDISEGGVFLEPAGLVYPTTPRTQEPFPEGVFEVFQDPVFVKVVLRAPTTIRGN